MSIWLCDYVTLCDTDKEKQKHSEQTITMKTETNKTESFAKVPWIAHGHWSDKWVLDPRIYQIYY